MSRLHVTEHIALLCVVLSTDCTKPPTKPILSSHNIIVEKTSVLPCNSVVYAPVLLYCIRVQYKRHKRLVFFVIAMDVIVQSLFSDHGSVADWTNILEGSREMYVLYVIHNIVLLSTSLATKCALK